MNPEQQFWWNWGIACAVAVGTLLTVAVALFGEQLKARWFSPVLRLRLLGSAGEKTQLKDANGSYLDDTRIYYVQVSNARRLSSPAEQVQMLLTRIEEPGPSGDLQTTWFGEIQIRWRNHEFVPLLRTIGAPADCDFCRVDKKGQLLLMPLILPNNLAVRWTGKCQFVAHLLARSTQVDSDVLRVKVSWDGGWEDGATEMQHHLKIEERNPERHGGKP